MRLSHKTGGIPGLTFSRGRGRGAFLFIISTVCSSPYLRRHGRRVRSRWPDFDGTRQSDASKWQNVKTIGLNAMERGRWLLFCDVCYISQLFFNKAASSCMLGGGGGLARRFSLIKKCIVVVIFKLRSDWIDKTFNLRRSVKLLRRPTTPFCYLQ